MKPLQEYLIYVCCVLFLTGCTSNLVTQKRALVVSDSSNPHVRTTSIPMDVRLARTIIASDGKTYVCDQPIPDVARGDAFGSRGQAGVKLSEGEVIKQDISTNGSVNSSTSVLQLNGRSSAVLLARDLMYQMCLSSANGTYTQQSSQFGQILDIVKKVADKEQTAAETNQLTAQALILKPEIIKNNQMELLGAQIYSLANTYHKCLVEAENNQDEITKCKVSLKQKINQKSDGE